MLEFRILGPLDVLGDRGQVPLAGPKQRATLAILLLDANRVVSVDRIADDLYAGAGPVTAVTQVQRQISSLRKVLGDSVIETRAPGYAIRLAPDQLDLDRFERRAEAAGRALAEGEPRTAADLYADALALWRGPPLADLASEPFAQASIERLEEIRLAAIEQRIEAELALGEHVRLVAELEALVTEHPLRERFCNQLMLALYRSGRQAEALDVYRRTREALVDELGIEPTPPLRRLERSILTQDPSLELSEATPARAHASFHAPREILVFPSSTDRLDALMPVAEMLARARSREVIVAQLLADSGELGHATSALHERLAYMTVASRAAAFTTDDAIGDVVRLATAYDVDLVVVDAPPGIASEALPDDVAGIFDRSPADVALVVRSPDDPERGAGVFVPFGGGDHDWSALELGAWLASAGRTRLTIVGTHADVGRGKRDASRLLADASLAVQRVIGVETSPLLADPTADALISAVEPASVVVAGVSPRWRWDGIGATRRALVRDSSVPMVIVHGGPHPGGLAPQESRTRFSWSIEER